jgi:triosephosphate isomerase
MQTWENRLMQSRKFIAGNWKMHGVGQSLDEARRLADDLRRTPSRARVALFPPATLVHRMSDLLEGSAVEVGGQDVHSERSGAFTGDVCAEMLRDAGATLVILGHSERRTAYGETDAIVAAKVEQGLRAGLEPIVCVGEPLAAREAGDAADVVSAQVAASLPGSLAGKAFSVAYEPIWAIGSGLTPTLAEIEAVHRCIRGVLVERFGEAGRGVPILYGGSVKPSNAGEILAADEVGGALVGGASLKADDFLAIIRAAG